MSEFLTSVPLHAIAAVVGGHGKHRVKRPSSYLTHSYNERNRGFRIIDRRRDVIAPLAGNLPNEEYRFFRGSPSSDMKFTACRFCGAICLSDTERADHKRLGYCTTNLVTVYKMASRATAPLCLVCQQHTWHEKWGVPLCNDADCLHDWKFQHAPMPLLQELISKASAKGLLIEGSKS